MLAEVGERRAAAPRRLVVRVLGVPLDRVEQQLPGAASQNRTAHTSHFVGHDLTVGPGPRRIISRLRQLRGTTTIRAMLVGRGLELELLTGRLAEERPLVVVTGEPGIGKTAVIRAALAAVGRQSFEGGAFATLSWMPLLPLTRAVGRDVAAGDAAYAAAAVEAAVGDGVLFLDDLHWADRPTLDAVALLRGRVALVTAVRRGAPGAVDALAAVGGADVLELDSLDEGDALELLHARSPELSEAAAARVARSAGGNPLLLEELAADGGVSDGLRLALEARLRALSEEARETMSLLALAGRPLDAATLPRGVHELVDAGLAVRTDDTVAVRHALLGETAGESLDPDERARVHALLADVVPTIGERAQHLAAAGRDADAYEAARAAATSAATPGERVAHLELAARCAPDDDGSVDLRLEAAEALANALMFRELKPLLERLDPEEPQRLARVELHRSFLELDLGDAAEAEHAVERGLELVGGTSTSTEGLLLLRKGVIAMFVHHDVERAIELVRAGAELTDDLDRPRALSTRAWVVAGTDAVPQDEWVAWFLEAIERAQATSNPGVELMARNNLCGCLGGSSTPLAARPHLDEALERARELRLRNWEVAFGWLGATLHSRAGRFAQAIAACDSLLAEPTQEQQRAELLYEKAAACIALGRFAEAKDALDAFDGLTARQFDVGHARVVHAELELWSGRPRDAALRIAALLEENRGEHVYVRTRARLVHAWACFELGEPVTPEPHDGAMVEDPIWGEEIRTLALIEDDPGIAATRFAEHATAFAPLSVRDELRCRWAAGEAARRAGDTELALAHLHEAERRAGQHGMQPLLGRIHRSLRLLGERRAAARGNAGGLTAREREILGLVGDGLTNPEIARRLGTSVPTVARQIATASQKLGAKSRAQAAILAAEA